MFGQEELWKKEVKATEKVEIFDISGEFFDPKVSLKEFKEKYPMFQGSIPDAEYEEEKILRKSVCIRKQ